MTLENPSTLISCHFQIFLNTRILIIWTTKHKSITDTALYSSHVVEQNRNISMFARGLNSLVMNHNGGWIDYLPFLQTQVKVSRD